MADHDQDAAFIKGPAPGAVGVLIIDMINDLSFEGAEKLQPKTEAVVSTVLRLRDCAAAPGPGGELTRRMAPRPDDYFVIKPQVSGFYATNLPVLLPHLGVSRLVLTGVAADICVLFTAADAHMRDYELWVPRDTVAGESDQRTDWALSIMRDALDAETRATTELDLEDWVAKARGAVGAR
jgi:hypothetical protein